MYLGKADVNTYDKGVEREFLVSNGSGNYGSSTVLGANTRREHGLLVARSKGAARHAVLVSKIEETLYAHNRKYQLSTNRYKDLIYPDGYRYLQEYQGTPIPSMLFVIHSIFLRKSIFMPQDGTCTIVKYELLASPEPLCMDLRPLFAHRINNEVSSALEEAEFSSAISPQGVVEVEGRGRKSYISFAKGPGEAPAWSKKPLWFENIVYERDGPPSEIVPDALYSPGFESLSLKQGECAYAVLSFEPLSYSFEELQRLERETIDRTTAYVAQALLPKDYSAVCDMVQSSYHLLADGNSPAIFSGFPSVELRARDTFIALPGLTLPTGSVKTARGILERWLQESEGSGVMPGSIDSSGNAIFDEIDSGLWFFYALGKYTAVGGCEEMKGRVKEILALLDAHVSGHEEIGLKMDSDTKLLRYSSHDGALRHWMSGNAGGEPLVDRRGYLVEINALWYNALNVAREIAACAGLTDRVKECEEIAAVCRESFVKAFWNEKDEYLYDWVDPLDGNKDDAIRPNAVLAISLPNPVLDEELGKKVLKTCWNELYTTYGLRTLDPHHEKFKGRAEGRPDQKKKARLRGMAWPWLLGQFISAYVRYNPNSMDIAWSFVRPFASHLRRGCVGGVAEYFDGMMPYKPNGDVLSAVSLGELLRVLHEDLNFTDGDI